VVQSCATCGIGDEITGLTRGVGKGMFSLVFNAMEGRGRQGKAGEGSGGW
jgi:hypothetical protein